MTTQDLNDILLHLPQKQREHATKRIRAAEMNGWVNICIHPLAGENADEADLCGNKANGDFDFLP